MSRGTTRRRAFGRRTRTEPKSSRSVITTRPSGPPAKPPLRLRSIRATAPGGGATVNRLVTPVGWPASASSSARRGAWSEARTIRAPSDAPTLEGLGEPPGPRRRDDRLAPAEEVARRQPAGRHRRTRREDALRFPGQLQGPRADQAALPVPRPEVGDRPILGQLAALDQLGAPLVGLPPQELGGLGQVGGLIEDQQGLAAGRGRSRWPGR